MISNALFHISSVSVKNYFRFLTALFLLTLSHAAPAVASTEKMPTTRKQIHVAVQLRTAELIRQEARRQKWPEYQAKMNLFIPSEVSQYSRCSQEPAVSLTSGNHIDLNRLRFDVRCDGPNGWDVAVTVKPDIYLPVVVAQTTLERGHTIEPGSMTIKKFNISNVRGGFLTHPDEVLGLTAKRRIREGQPISLNQLESVTLVERGQRVLMIAELHGVEARTMGEAMKKGRKGEIIKVKNESSGRIVSAIVTASGVVSMVYTNER